VTQSDIRIVQRARELLNSPAKWNRADDRNCPATEKSYSLYCALVQKQPLPTFRSFSISSRKESGSGSPRNRTNQARRR
jgi:hypothetical protein